MKHIRGLDTIRMVLAAFVVMSHLGGPPIVAGADRSSHLGLLLYGISGNLWNGPAAVIAFFIISGFCIHYPFSRDFRIPSLPSYFGRRYVRIVLPLLAVILFANSLGVKLTLLNDNIMWTLACELIYYTLYPGLLVLRSKGVPWLWMFGATFVLALLLAATHPEYKNYPNWGISLNWVFGLPCWLLGCELAERTLAGRLFRSDRIWTWRLGIWILAAAASGLRYHTPIGYPWTLNAFAIPSFYWLSLEIGRYQHREPLRWLEWSGRFSYSVYLAHLPANALLLKLALPNLGYFINWATMIISVFFISYIFYLCVELPSHVAARTAARVLGRKRIPLPPQDVLAIPVPATTSG